MSKEMELVAALTDAITKNSGMFDIAGLITSSGQVYPLGTDTKVLSTAFELGGVDKRDSHLPRVLIQDCFLRSSHGSWRLVGCGMGVDRAAAAA